MYRFTKSLDHLGPVVGRTTYPDPWDLSTSEGCSGFIGALVDLKAQAERRAASLARPVSFAGLEAYDQHIERLIEYPLARN